MKRASGVRFGPATLLPMLRDPRVLEFVLIYLLIQMSVYGAIFYLPAEVSALMHKPAGLEVGLVTAIPWICALCAVYWLPKAADKWKQPSETGCAHVARCWLRQLCFSNRGTADGAGHAVDCGLRLHRRSAALLDVSHRIPGRSRQGRRHRADRSG